MMTDYKTMRVPVDAYERAKADKEDREVTWGEWLTLPCDNGVEQQNDPIPAELGEKLDRIESAATTAEDRTGDIQRTLEGLR